MSLHHRTDVIQNITIAGKVIRLVEAARRAKLAPATIRGRLRCGWSDEQAIGLAPPPRPPRRKSNPGVGRKQRDLPPISDGSEETERLTRVEGDELFTEAMIEAGYTPHIHTDPCTERPVFVQPDHIGRMARSSIWDTM